MFIITLLCFICSSFVDAMEEKGLIDHVVDMKKARNAICLLDSQLLEKELSNKVLSPNNKQELINLKKNVIEYYKYKHTIKHKIYKIGVPLALITYSGIEFYALLSAENSVNNNRHNNFLSWCNILNSAFNGSFALLYSGMIVYDYMRTDWTVPKRIHDINQLLSDDQGE